MATKRTANPVKGKAVKAKAVKSVKPKAVKAKPVKPRASKGKVVQAKVVKGKTVKGKAVRAKAVKAKTVKRRPATSTRDDALFEGFCSELSAAIDDVMPWFRRVSDNPKYDGTRELRFMHMWPSGVGAHPRVIDVVRRSLVSAEALIQEREVAESDTEQDTDESDEQYSTPREMLLARLRYERPKLFEHLARFFFLPIGFDDHVLTSGDAKSAVDAALVASPRDGKRSPQRKENGPKDTEVVLHDVQRGRLRLHMNPKDFRDASDPTSSLSLVSCPAAHAQAHAAWLSEATFATDEAMQWWRSIVERFRGSGATWPEAARAAYEEWPAGPAASEYVVSVVRRHWLAAVKRNAALASRERILPEDFLIETLDPRKHARIILVLTAMPYWPMGFNPKGDWC